jgi:hypothetical protein
MDKTQYIVDDLRKIGQSELDNIYREVQYSKEEVRQMRISMSNEVYDNPHNVIESCICVWENGKVGRFIPFEHNGILYHFGGKKDSKGLKFVQTDKKGGILLVPQMTGIVISGFGEYVLENWGKNLSKLCENYTFDKHNKLIEQWETDNYPNKIDKQNELQLLIELKNTEQTQWNKAIIGDFFTQNDNERLNQCMNKYFNWLDSYLEYVNPVKTKDNPHLYSDAIEQPKLIQVPQPEISEQRQTNGDNVCEVEYDYSKVLENYKFWNNQNDKIQGHVNIFQGISERQFIEMINTADFTVIDKKKRSQRVKYNIYILARILGKEWGKKAAKKLNTTLSECLKMTGFKEYKFIKGIFLK